MKIIRRILQMRSVVSDLRKKGKTIGFVPTMGALHDGHISLVTRAKKENDAAVVSIFVNPAQFGPKEDFRRYPRNLKKDAKMCGKAGADFIFVPEAKEIYPEGYAAYVNVEGDLAKVLEAASRPGHFRGVATVVAKLFNIVLPDKAYFGEKDYQQLLVIKKMAEDLDLPVRIVPCPTVRERDGLAISSRNAYLSPEQRKTALVISRTLKKAVHAARDHGFTDAKKLSDSIRSAILSQPGIKLDYAAIRGGTTLEPVKRIEKGCVILIAAKVGKTRLIDNMRI
ncbi:pantoate--beta-alanine ligase [Candidatus Desantisbacteria bacterium CG_4_10_14_0_8_um_filter_48_22]|uniref:Pantothenate synthetase n=1 Tax=Candidatus Desantisbacteria bacterium CG_4_10_14_0_8_um_filter_48_22 TaxID=1974543 RepID=A0A2M7SA71_9BACT|nr:MAG: pantoate--beta-alanine ligase [Candidatus Desantisbacteria bacterium CG1_02_49_89]PIV54231.1 MAG: pantoate--beta-alanine ligase [Candidatus Desantisbacteria bacterium CG02_land_8_20_14_3_00_49_13]PIZ16348.1 MAG: pantoate--beta-alanine ligase [Candidatus Desantisbacteria bacterium CG_4_10_14_0_8_um_filter_48_22]PJB27427.1 MAG: pantoate--beta-alanine ligase [Candidatus Desantisbacteria bacterium CG_4_9_14_3_um_filter_50_7]